MDVQFKQDGANGFDTHWLARVEGEESGLRALVVDVCHESFRFFKDKGDAEYLLEAAVFGDCHTPQQVAAQARIIVDLAIGALSFLGRKVWPVRVSHIIRVGYHGQHEVTRLPSESPARGRVKSATAPPLILRTPDIVGAGLGRPHLIDALKFFSWSREPWNLYRTYEAALYDIDGRSKNRAEAWLTAQGWASKSDLSWFRESMNELLGDEARHSQGQARRNGDTGRPAMSQPEAEDLVWCLLFRLLNYRIGRGAT